MGVLARPFQESRPVAKPVAIGWHRARLYFVREIYGMQLADWLAYHAGVVGPTRLHMNSYM